MHSAGCYILDLARTSSLHLRGWVTTSTAAASAAPGSESLHVVMFDFPVLTRALHMDAITLGIVCRLTLNSKNAGKKHAAACSFLAAFLLSGILQCMASKREAGGLVRWSSRFAEHFSTCVWQSFGARHALFPNKPKSDCSWLRTMHGL